LPWLGRRRWLTLVLLVWALLQCYSRIYLGVHFPGDILGGAIVGVLVAALVYGLWQYCFKRLRISERQRYLTATDCQWLVGAALVSCLCFCVIALL